MGKFSERIGATQARVLIQSSSLDTPTRTALWNSLRSTLSAIETESYHSMGRYADVALLRDAWANELERAIDEFEEGRALKAYKHIFLEGDWWRVLDAVQWMLVAIPHHWSRRAESFSSAISSDLSRYMVGYRVLGSEIIPVSSEQEVEEIEQALASVGTSARTHLNRATALLSNREKPQYAKVIHEAVNAVEAVVGELTGEHVLSAGLKKLEASGVPTHKALLSAWGSLYGYTSDASGIRHALVRDEDADEPLAVYFLVTCSAFINMLLKLAPNK